MEHVASKAIEDHWDVEEIRNEFPLLKNTMHGKPLVFLDSAASSQKPRVVIDAISQYYSSQHANVHRGVYALSANATDLFEAAREATRAFIHAQYDHEIVFTRGTTESINLVAHSFGQKHLNQGDEVIISAMEHHSNIVPWQMACEANGAKLKIIPLLDDGTIRIEDVRDLISNRTKFISLVHISNALGTINPIQEVIDLAHHHDIPVMIDGAQAVPHLPINVVELDVDFYAFSGHKMYGPTGIGVLYGKEKWLEDLPPYQGGGEMIKKVTFEKTTYNELPFKFEAGTPNIAGTIGLKAAIDFLGDLPSTSIEQHETSLLEYGTSLLKELPGLHLIGTAPNKAGVLSFIIDGLHPYDIGTLLDHQGIAVRTGHHCTEPIMDRFGIAGTVRASLGLYNTHEELDQLASAVSKAINMLK
ncbi:MAG: cysteine desulfurase [Saprospiraceae bacterium]|nr:cysteine desulfurase [Saprospiraceae bacterium]